MPAYDKRKVRKAMLLAPLVGALATLPYLMFLNLSAGQWVTVAIVAVILSYLFATIIGGLGYFVLKRLDRHENKYLYAYAIGLVLIAAIAYMDLYVLISIGPPVLLATVVFCYLRGAPEQAS